VEGKPQQWRPQHTIEGETKMSKAMNSEATATPTRVNGVDIETLMGTVNAIKGEPELGACRFRARNSWLGGNHNRSTVTGFFLAGNDEGANPVEHLLHALASCLTTSMVAHAAVRGIEIEELESELEGDIDLRGFLGLDLNVPKGYTEIRAKFRVRARPEDLDRIRELARFSPVFHTITRGAKVAVEVDLK
jgi:uncharacterized OsmC-like protein